MATVLHDIADARYSKGESRMRLFHQIAVRLLAVAVLFAVLDIAIVVLMYARDDATLSEDLVSMEAERVATHLRVHGLRPAERIFASSPQRAAAVVDPTGSRVLTENPGGLALPPAPSADLRSMTAREVRGERYLLTGWRRSEVDGRAYWIAIAISGEGLRTLLPALYREVAEHALLPMIPLSLLLLAFNVVIVRRMLSPLEQAVRDADALDPSVPGRRLRLPKSPIEVRTLVGAVNRAFERIEVAMRTLGQFTADAAHELRTPLAVMTLTIERLPPSVEKAKLSEDAASMRRLIGQLLDLARAEVMDIAADAHTDLHGVASRVVAEMTPVALSRGKRIDYFNDGNSLVHGSADSIERALRNLIENALTHAPEGEVIDVTVEFPPRIGVRDRGSGIPDDIREDVFERFWRADPNRKGTGLGLAIARAVMQAYGGRVEIRSAPGGGALVSLVFPHS